MFNVCSDLCLMYVLIYVQCMFWFMLKVYSDLGLMYILINYLFHESINDMIKYNIITYLNYNILPNIIEKLQRYIVMETVTDCIP